MVTHIFTARVLLFLFDREPAKDLVLAISDRCSVPLPSRAAVSSMHGALHWYQTATAAVAAVAAVAAITARVQEVSRTNATIL